jgi:cyclopropane fatty-acyl-phospholipid synthase-like methyltransferase
MSMLSKNNVRLFKRLYAVAKKPEDLPWNHDQPTHFLNEIVAARPQGGRALDMGCGSGVDSVFLAQNGWDVTSLDFMQEALTMTRRLAAGAGVRLNVYRTDITIWAGDGKFDLILDAGCLHALRLAYCNEYKQKLLNWMDPGADYVLRHAERMHLWQWRPFGPKRIPRRKIIRRFAPELVEHAFDRHIFTGVKLPWGPSFAHTTYWFKQESDSGSPWIINEDNQ